MKHAQTNASLITTYGVLTKTSLANAATQLTITADFRVYAQVMLSLRLRNSGPVLITTSVDNAR